MERVPFTDTFSIFAPERIKPAKSAKLPLLPLRAVPFTSNLTKTSLKSIFFISALLDKFPNIPPEALPSFKTEMPVTVTTLPPSEYILPEKLPVVKIAGHFSASVKVKSFLI